MLFKVGTGQGVVGGFRRSKETGAITVSWGPASDYEDAGILGYLVSRSIGEGNQAFTRLTPEPLAATAFAFTDQEEI